MERGEIRTKWETLSPRERDAWVAEVVTGVERRKRLIDCPDGIDGCAVAHYVYYPRYTTDISAAWAILTEVSREFFLYRSENGGFVASFGYSAEECSECGDEPFEVEAQGKSDNVPEAMCLAALIAKLTEGAD